MLLLFVTTLFLIIQFSITTGAGAGLICVVWNNYKPFTGVLRAFNTLRYNKPLLTLKSIYGAASGLKRPYNRRVSYQAKREKGKKPLFEYIKIMSFISII